MQVWPLWVMERGGRKRRAEGGRKEEEGRGESWWSGRILDCTAVLRKSSKTDETSWNWHCPWEKSHISQEWVFLSIATPCTHLLALPHSVMKQPLGNMTSVRKKQAWISEQRSWGYQSAVTVCENYIFHCCHIVCVLVAKSCLTLATPWTVARWALFPWDSPGKNTGVDCQSLLQGSSRPRDRTRVFLHCRQVLLLLSH